LSTKQFDVVILGGGTGGYVAAIRAAQLGKSVAVVEREKLGGTCLHKGCIPSKALLRSAEMLHDMLRSEEFGILANDVQLDFGRVQQRKDSIVDQLHQGVQYLMKKNKIEVFEGEGRVIGPSIFSPRSGSIAVALSNGDSVTVVAEHTIIATGSRPRKLDGLAVDGEIVLTSDDALRLEKLPQSIVIVGGGVIGVEWASMFNDFGVAVTIVEMGDRLIPSEDESISKELEKLFKARGIQVYTNASFEPSEVHAGAGSVSLSIKQGDKVTTIEAEKLLLSIGRVANVDGLGLENTDVRIERNVIPVNEHMQTSEAHIYAIGDVNGGLQLAHVAAHEGIRAVDHLAGIDSHATSDVWIPKCIYTRPEVASVGYTEQQAKDAGREVKVGTFPFKAIGKALVHGATDGFVKVIADKNTDDLLGVHMIGPHVTDYISEAALAHVLDATPWEIASAVHAHPTLSEGLAEAMLAVDGKAIGM
jgi:dihydrolipoamide dehydrogenase